MSSIKWYANRIKSYIGRPRLIIQEKPIILTEGNRCENPIFIAGVHRSGTSLVRRMFNSHPDIACPPETYYLEYYAKMYSNPDVEAGYEGLGYDKSAMREDLARKASELHEAYRISQGKSVWADKTPQYTFNLDSIDDLFNREAKYFIVLRHPCDIVFSIFKRGWNFGSSIDPFEAAISHVNTGIQCLLNFEKSHPSRCSRINYFSLCSDPASTLDTALKKLSLQYSEEMLRFSEKKHNFGTEDPVVRGKTSVTLSSGSWKELSPDKLQRLRTVFGDDIDQEDYWSNEQYNN